MAPFVAEEARLAGAPGGVRLAQGDVGHAGSAPAGACKARRCSATARCCRCPRPGHPYAQRG
eukprot:8385437-Alexandrium_andersonii.AAC.1